MNMTRRGWIQFILNSPIIGNLVLQFFFAKNDTSKNTYLMNRFHIAGFQFYDGPRWVGKMKPGELLTLTAEDDNPHDRFAVKIERNGVKVGYVPRTDNFHVSRLIRRGADLRCEVEAVSPDKEPWWMVRVRVELVA